MRVRRVEPLTCTNATRVPDAPGVSRAVAPASPPHLGVSSRRASLIYRLDGDQPHCVCRVPCARPGPSSRRARRRCTPRCDDDMARGSLLAEPRCRRLRGVTNRTSVQDVLDPAPAARGSPGRLRGPGRRTPARAAGPRRHRRPGVRGPARRDQHHHLDAAAADRDDRLRRLDLRPRGLDVRRGARPHRPGRRPGRQPRRPIPREPFRDRASSAPSASTPPHP